MASTEYDKLKDYSMTSMDDNGQTSLEMDMKVLLADVIDENFHDFKSDKHATPKMALVTRLEQLIADTKGGKYDNKS